MEANDFTAYKDFLRSSLEEWKSLEDSDIQLDKFQSMSNLVFKATSAKNVNPKIVVFRKFQPLFMGFPKEKFGFLSPEQENLVFLEMSKRGFGPKCLAVNDKYRIEEYIDALKIENEDLKRIEVRRWHILAITNFNKLKVEGLKKKDPTYDTYLNSAEFFQDFEDKIAKLEFTPEGQELVNEFKGIASMENREFMKKIIPRDDLVLCHGDQNLFNILVSKESGKVTLVDYERTGISFKGDDIGCFNFFSVVDVFYPEPPKMKVYEQNYPSEDLYRDLAEYYVVFYDMDDETVKNQAEKMIFNKNLFDEYVRDKYKGEEFEEKVKKMIRNLKISFMGYSFCVVIGSLKYYSGKLNILLYAQAAYRYFMKLKEELEKDI